MDSYSFYDVAEPGTAHQCQLPCHATARWQSPGFSFDGQENSTSDFIDVLNRMDSGSASPGDEAEPGAVPGQQRTAAEAVEQAATVTPPRDRRKRYSEADRLERRRARNRAAQARFRQKQRVRAPSRSQASVSCARYVITTRPMQLTRHFGATPVSGLTQPMLVVCTPAIPSIRMIRAHRGLH